MLDKLKAIEEKYVGLENRLKIPPSMQNLPKSKRRSLPL